MKWLNSSLVLGIFCWPGAAWAELQLLPGKETPCVFAGGAREIFLVWHNDGDKIWEGEISARIFQASSATAVKLGEVPWKKLSVLPQQTIVETAQLDFPAVKAETRFLIQWAADRSGTGFQPVKEGDATGEIIARPSDAELTGKMPVPLLGKTEVLVYPTNLLAELKPLAGDAAPGIFDPQNQIKPLLKNLKVEFSDLESSGLENFPGRLAIVWPFTSKTKMREGLAEQIQALAKKGAAIVWIQPPQVRGEKLSPSFYPVVQNQSAVVIVQPELVSDLADNPQAQLNLIYFCKLALKPQPLTFPSPSPQP